MQSRTVRALVGACVLSVTSPALAGDPNPPSGITEREGQLADPFASTKADEGRALPLALRELAWKKACDMIPDAYADCAGADAPKCVFTKSDGARFAAASNEWETAPYAARNGLGYSVLDPVARESNLPAPAEPHPDTLEAAFRLLAGIPLMTQLTGGEDDWGKIVELNPAAVAWAQRELLPEPTQPMCGQTAQKIYDDAFKPLLRSLTVAYAHVHKSKLTEKVDREALDKANYDREGKLWTTCSRLEKGGPAKLYGGIRLREGCRFWLRRASVGQTPMLAQALGTVLERFDPTFYKTHKKVLTPKVAKAR